VVLDAPVSRRSVAAVAAAAAAAAAGRRQRVERVDEAVVGVRVLADDGHVVPAIGVEDANDRSGRQCPYRVQLQVHRPATLTQPSRTPCKCQSKFYGVLLINLTTRQRTRRPVTRHNS